MNCESQGIECPDEVNTESDSGLGSDRVIHYGNSLGDDTPSAE